MAVPNLFTHLPSSVSKFACAASMVLVAMGCSGSSSSAPKFPASVPAGSGQVSIQMTGTWEVRDVTPVRADSNSQAPPANGTRFVLDGSKIVSIAGFEVTQANLESVLGSPLTTYVNRIDSRTILYGIATDRRASGGTRDEAALAGGAVDDNTIAVEAYTSTQAANTPSASIAVTRYTLARIDTALQPATLSAEDVRQSEDARSVVLRLPFGLR